MANQGENAEFPRLLYVDDAREQHRMYERVFKFIFDEADVRVDLLWAYSAEEGLYLLAGDNPASRPDGVLTDGLKGRCWEVIDAALGSNIPAALFSGTGELVEEALRRGVPALSKPQIPEKLGLFMATVYPFMTPPGSTQ